MFPFSRRGRIEFRDRGDLQVSTEAFLQQIERGLEERKMSYTSRTANGLSFRRGMFQRTSGWDLFAFIKAGEIMIETQAEPTVVLYELRFSPTLIVGIGIFVLLFGLVLLSASGLTGGAKIGLLAFVVFLLVGVNFVLPILRFASFIRSIRSGMERP